MTSDSNQVSSRSRPACARDAMILAAGNGSRLRSAEVRPKAILPVLERPLLARGLDALQDAGLERVYIVVGHGADAIRRCHGIERDGLEVRWLYNDQYNEPNGLSLLCGRSQMRDTFALVMADHLFDAETVRRFVAEVPPPDGGLLAVDSRTTAVFDPDDATRVLVRNGQVLGIGKGLAAFNAVDTGLFVLTAAAFDAMEESARKGDRSLTGGISTLAGRGVMRSWDIGPGRWIDVDTPAAAAEAARLLGLGLLGPRPCQLT